MKKPITAITTLALVLTTLPGIQPIHAKTTKMKVVSQIIIGDEGTTSYNSYSYNKNGLITRNTITIKDEYKPTKKDTYQYTYNTKGITSRTHKNNKTVYTLNNQGLVTKATNNNYSTAYTYNSKGLLTSGKRRYNNKSQLIAKGSTHYQYNHKGYISKRTEKHDGDTDTYTFKYHYNRNNLVTKTDITISQHFADELFQDVSNMFAGSYEYRYKTITVNKSYVKEITRQQDTLTQRNGYSLVYLK